MPTFLVKEFKGSLVDEQNFSLVIQQDQAFLNGFKYLLEKTLLFRQLDKKALEVFLLDVVNAADQLVNGVFFHGGGSVAVRLALIYKERHVTNQADVTYCRAFVAGHGSGGGGRMMACLKIFPAFPLSERAR